jgi:hypothetical protein
VTFDLFEQKTVTFQPRNPDGTEAGPPQKIADYWAISEERFNALPDDKFLELKANGAIGAIYAHMVSLLNWQRVIQRAMRIAGVAEPAACQRLIPAVCKQQFEGGLRAAFFLAGPCLSREGN